MVAPWEIDADGDFLPIQVVTGRDFPSPSESFFRQISSPVPEGSEEALAEPSVRKASGIAHSLRLQLTYRWILRFCRGTARAQSDYSTARFPSKWKSKWTRSPVVFGDSGGVSARILPSCATSKEPVPPRIEIC